MHFEILIEDISGKTALEILIPKIISDEHTFNIHSYKGIGRIPQGLTPSSDPKKRILLDQMRTIDAIPCYGRARVGGCPLTEIPIQQIPGLDAQPDGTRS